MSQSVIVNNVPIEWHQGGEGFTFFGIEAVIFWQDPSLLTILKPLRETLGEPLYSALIAYESTKGTYEDYHAMVEQLGSDFYSGFMSWGRAVSGAGWGVFDLQAIDWNRAEARVRIDRPWELNLFWPFDPDYAVPFLAGKLSGIFSWAFATYCRARVKELERTPEGYPYVVLSIAPSSDTLEDELRAVRERHGLSRDQALQLTTQELRAQLDRFVAVVQAVGEFVWESDRSLRLVYSTERITDALGYKPAELDRVDLRDLLTPKGRERIDGWLATAQSDGETGSLEVPAYHRNGELRWLALGLVAVLDRSGGVIGYRGVGRDITEAKQAESELRLLATAFETSQAIAIIDHNATIQRVNEGFERITGFRSANIVGCEAHQVLPPSPDGPGFTGIREALSEYRRWEGECGCWTATAETVPIRLAASVSPAAEGGEEYIVVSFHDLSQQKRLERRLEWEATHDHLTSLYNRGQFERLLDYEVERAARYGRPLSLVLFDIDHFKTINDTYGHAVGDTVLRELAGRLPAYLRSSDVLARWGGEEFAVLVPETNMEGARLLADKLRAIVADKPFPYALQLTVSLGVSELLPETGGQALTRAADNALYEAKWAGRNCVVVADQRSH